MKQGYIKIQAVVAVVLALGLLLAGCSTETQPLDAFFVRGGLMLTGAAPDTVSVLQEGKTIWRPGDELIEIGQAKSILLFPWQAGQSYQLKSTDSAKQLGAPQKPSPALICRIDLESSIPHGGGMGGRPNTQVRFSPDGSHLAIGSFGGYLRIVRTLSGQTVLKRKMAEGMVKRLAWGQITGQQVLYVGEQSPDSNIYCIDTKTGEEIWRRRLAEQVGTGKPDSDKRHSVFNLPGVYFLKTLPNGDILCACTYGRFSGEDYVHDCRLYRLDGATGRIKWLWPREMNFPYGITWVGASQSGQILAIISFSTIGPTFADHKFKPGTLYCLDGDSGEVRWNYKVPPLKPYYSRVGSWQGVAVSPDGQRVTLGLDDGRAMMFDAHEGSHLWTKKLGTPVLVGDIPVAAPLSYAVLGKTMAYFTASTTTIPLALGTSRLHRPPPHPHANLFFALDNSGDIAWQYKFQGSCQGIFLSRDNKLVATTVGQNYGSKEIEHYGVTLFNASIPGGASRKLIYHYSTEGPSFFQVDMSENGRFLAISETPYSPDEGKTVYGAYRVHIIH